MGVRLLIETTTKTRRRQRQTLREQGTQSGRVFARRLNSFMGKDNLVAENGLNKHFFVRRLFCLNRNHTKTRNRRETGFTIEYAAYTEKDLE